MRHCPLHRLARIILPCLLGLLATAAAQAENSEAGIKAAFIYNFAKFVEWPEDTFTTPKDHLVLCTQGDSALARKLRLLAGREAQGRTIDVRLLAGSEAPVGCHILLATASNEIPVSAQANAILTISESASPASQSSMINLFIDANRVQFSVNLPATQQAGIKVSARLLQLARTVNKGG